MDAPTSTACAEVFKDLKNPYYLGDEIGLPQSLGWVDAWTLLAGEIDSCDDILRRHDGHRIHTFDNLRIVVKGGGHSYQGTSNAADSLLIWMRKTNAVIVHDAFVAVGCAGRDGPEQAVTVEAGAIWGHVYDAVTTRAGRYVQGGACLTVGVAGLIQSGGSVAFPRPMAWLLRACWRPSLSPPRAR